MPRSVNVVASQESEVFDAEAVQSRTEQPPSLWILRMTVRSSERIMPRVQQEVPEVHETASFRKTVPLDTVWTVVAE